MQRIFNSVFMYSQILVPDRQNATIPIPAEWFGMEVMIMAYPITAQQSQEKRQFTWLTGNSKIDHPVCIGENFKKISRDEIYDRKSLY